MAQLAAVTSGAAQMFGVNLGSWLVLESWMVPAIFAIIPYGLPYGEQQLMLVSLQRLSCRLSCLVHHINSRLFSCIDMALPRQLDRTTHTKHPVLSHPHLSASTN